MAAFFADAAGQIIAFRDSLGVEESPDFTGPPVGTVYTLQFDEATNEGIVTDYYGDTQAFAMVGGTLTKNATPVTINPDSAAYAGFRNHQAFLSKLNNTTDPLTRKEMAEAFSLLFRDAGRTLQD